MSDPGLSGVPAAPAGVHDWMLAHGIDPATYQPPFAYSTNTVPAAPRGPGSGLRVSQLIAAAQRHLERHGDSPVGLVVNGPRGEVLHIENVVRTGYDKYAEDEELMFEVEADSEGNDE